MPLLAEISTDSGTTSLVTLVVLNMILSAVPIYLAFRRDQRDVGRVKREEIRDLEKSIDTRFEDVWKKIDKQDEELDRQGKVLSSVETSIKHIEKMQSGFDSKLDRLIQSKN